MCLAMRVCTPPTNLPPTKTDGTGCSAPAIWFKKDRIAFPSDSLSSSTIVGPTPRLMRKRLATVDMQQSLKLKITTALEEAKWWTASQGVMLSLKGSGGGCDCGVASIFVGMIGGRERVKDIWRIMKKNGVIELKGMKSVRDYFSLYRECENV